MLMQWLSDPTNRGLAMLIVSYLGMIIAWRIGAKEGSRRRSMTPTQFQGFVRMLEERKYSMEYPDTPEIDTEWFALGIWANKEARKHGFESWEKALPVSRNNGCGLGYILSQSAARWLTSTRKDR